MGEWTSWLIIVAVVALAVGPVMMFQPSAGQRKLAQIRAYANQHGVRVRLASKSIPELSNTACYALPWQDRRIADMQWQLVRKAYTHGLHLNGVWAWQKKGNKTPEESILLKPLALLPETIKGVSASPEGLSVNWDEKGGEQELVELLKWLTDLQRILVMTL